MLEHPPPVSSSPLWIGGEVHTIESLSCNSSSFLFEICFSFLASSALRTESVSFFSLSWSLCSIICLFFAWTLITVRRKIQITRRGGRRKGMNVQHLSHSFLCLPSSLCLRFRPKGRTSSFPSFVRVAQNSGQALGVFASLEQQRERVWWWIPKFPSEPRQSCLPTASTLQPYPEVSCQNISASGDDSPESEGKRTRPSTSLNWVSQTRW